jgi:hypothetical protein
MKTREQILKAVRAGRHSQCLDGRDYSRLADFFPVEVWPVLGFEPKEGTEPPPPKEITRENVLECLEQDVAFGFEKALDKRGISSGLMYEVVKMWMWVLDDPLMDFDSYPMYGLPLFKAVAVKYGFENPIGQDNGDEAKYNGS